MTPVGYAPAALATVEGPKPRVKVGGILIVAGAVLSIICCFLPWVTEGDRSINGFDDFILLTDNDVSLIESPATFMIVVALIVGGLGVALLAAGRVLAVAIIAIVGAAIFEILGLAMIGFSAGHTDLNGGDVGVGAIMQAVVPLVSLAGAIVATATRRKPVPATSTGMPGPGAPTQF